MYGTKRPNIFRKIIPKEQWQDQEEDIAKNIEKAFAKMKRKALEREKRRRRGNAKWKPQVGERVPVRTQRISDAVKGITSKFVPLFEGPYKITRVFL